MMVQKRRGEWRVGIVHSDAACLAPWPMVRGDTPSLTGVVCKHLVQTGGAIDATLWPVSKAAVGAATGGTGCERMLPWAPVDMTWDKQLSNHHAVGDEELPRLAA